MSVFVPTRIKEDLTQVGEYGLVQYVCQYYVHADELDGETLPEDVRVRIEATARVFRPDQDYMLLAGDHLLIAALSVALFRYHQWFRILRWDRQAKGYYVVRISA